MQQPQDMGERRRGGCWYLTGGQVAAIAGEGTALQQVQLWCQGCDFRVASQMRVLERINMQQGKLKSEQSRRCAMQRRMKG